MRIVSPPRHGTVALNGHTATCHPEPDFVGTDSFTCAAWDGSTDSNLGTVSLSVAAGNCTLILSALAPDTLGAGTAAPFRARRTGCDLPVTFVWSWSDDAPPGQGAEVCRSFTATGNYQGHLTATAGTRSESLTGTVAVTAVAPVEVSLLATRSGSSLQLSWPVGTAGYVLQTSPSLVPPAWQPAGLAPAVVGDRLVVTISPTAREQYFRLIRAP